MSSERLNRDGRTGPDERFLLRLGTALAGTTAAPTFADLTAAFEREREALERYREHLTREVATVDQRLAELRALLGY